MEVTLPGSEALCWGKGVGGHRVSGGSSRASPQARYFWAKGFQEQKINVNLRPPGCVNRSIMELYTLTHPHTHIHTHRYTHAHTRTEVIHTYRKQEHTTNTPTHTNCPGIICTVDECFVFCSHCCRRSERMTGWTAEERETERSKKTDNKRGI